MKRLVLCLIVIISLFSLTFSSFAALNTYPNNYQITEEQRQQIQNFRNQMEQNMTEAQKQWKQQYQEQLPKWNSRWKGNNNSNWNHKRNHTCRRNCPNCPRRNNR